MVLGLGYGLGCPLVVWAHLIYEILFTWIFIQSPLSLLWDTVRGEAKNRRAWVNFDFADFVLKRREFNMGPIFWYMLHIHKNMIFSHWIVFYYSKKTKIKPLLALWGCIFQLLLRWHWEKWNFLLKLIRSQLVRSYLRKNIDSDMTDLRSCRCILRDWKIAKTWNKKVERMMCSHSLRLDVVYTWPFHPAREFYKITKPTVNYNFVVVDLGRFDPITNKNCLIS